MAPGGGLGRLAALSRRKGPSIDFASMAEPLWLLSNTPSCQPTG